MQTIRFSVVIFYNDSGKILLQDRRNLSKDAIEWGWFGGRAEGDETPIEAALREIREEMDLALDPDDFALVGTLIAEKHFIPERREGTIYAVRWRDAYEKAFHVLEGAGSEWMTPAEMRSRIVYDAQRVHLTIFEEYLKTLHA